MIDLTLPWPLVIDGLTISVSRGIHSGGIQPSCPGPGSPRTERNSRDNKTFILNRK